MDVDPKNLEFEFARPWLQFRDGRVGQFLSLWTQKRISDLRTKLENTPTHYEMAKVQGAIAELRSFLALVNSSNVNTQMQEVLNHIDTYGK